MVLTKKFDDTLAYMIECGSNLDGAGQAFNDLSECMVKNQKP